MLSSPDDVLLHAALVKWMMGEPMSTQDINRVIDLLQSGRLQPDQASPDKIAGLQNRLITTLDQLSNAIKQNQQQPQ